MSDLINREKLIDNIKQALSYSTPETLYRNMTVERILNAIDEEEAVDAAPIVHAHWEDLDNEPIELDEDGCPVKSAFCSNCHEWLTGSEEYACKGYYCPNCGAKMDEVIE